MFIAVLAGLVTPHVVDTVRGAMRRGGAIQALPRGGAKNVKDPITLLLLKDFIARLPQEDQHYALTAVVNRDKVVLKRYWIRSRIYWRWVKLYDPLYYAECQWLRQCRLRGDTPPDNFKPRKPRLGMTKAYQFICKLDMRIGKEHKDDCATCYEHGLYIKYGADNAAGADAVAKGKMHAELKAEHMRHADAANILQVAEQVECLRQTAEDADKPPVECKCGLGPFECACHFLTRDGFELIQQDKGAKLRLPYMPRIGTLFYFSHNNMIFEHITAYSQPPDKGRRAAYAWDELVATVGANNMISVNYHYLCHNPSGRQGLVLWCDNCFKELKNWTIVYYAFYLVHVKKMFRWVVIRWYEKGHSSMGGQGPDSSQAKITLAGKDIEKVVPADYRKIAEKAAGGNIAVVDFVAEFHKNWVVWLGQFFTCRRSTANKETGQTAHNVDSEGRRIDLRDFRWIRIDTDKHPGWVQAFTEMKPDQQPVLIDVVRKRPEKYHVASPVDRRLTMPANQISFNQAKGLLHACVFMTEEQKAHYRPQLALQRAIWSVKSNEAKKQNFVKLRDRLMAGDVDPASAGFAELIVDPREGEDRGDFDGLTDSSSDQQSESDDGAIPGGKARAEAQKISRKRKKMKLARARKRRTLMRDRKLKKSLRDSVVVDH
jgi:hypothetical protein